MARIAGVDLPRNKQIEIALTYIFGVGKGRATQTCAALAIDPNTKVRDLTEDEAMTYGAWVGALIGLGAGEPDRLQGVAAEAARDVDQAVGGNAEDRIVPRRVERALRRRRPVLEVAGIQPDAEEDLARAAGKAYAAECEPPNRIRPIS
mgnify:CR=1 FL=1